MPEFTAGGDVPCQEEIHYASEEGFDIRKLLPAPQNTEEDAGPISPWECATPQIRLRGRDVTIHRLCLQSADEMTMFFTPGCATWTHFGKKAEREGVNLPISISIGVDPAIEIASCFEPPTTPLGFNELSIAGALRKSRSAWQNAGPLTNTPLPTRSLSSRASWWPRKRMREDINTNTGKAMPEFPGYTGHVSGELPVIKIKAVTHRKNPIIQTCIGPSEEHVSMAGIPTEASILTMEEKALAGRVKMFMPTAPAAVSTWRSYSSPNGFPATREGSVRRRSCPHRFSRAEACDCGG